MRPNSPAGARAARRPLARAFYARPTLVVAAELVGKVLVHRGPEGLLAGGIVEVEAYIGESDPACHAAPGPTARNAPLYGEPGMAYVYLNYGIHRLVNAVTEPAGRPAAVLIRALAPIDGVDVMTRLRGPRGRAPRAHELCRGPGNLTKALGITLDHNRADLTGAPLSIEDWGLDVPDLEWGPRIGIRVGTDRPWRCWARGHPSVSAPRGVRPARR